MEHGINHSARGSWLSLVAETAGVPGATIARVELHCAEALRSSEAPSSSGTPNSSKLRRGPVRSPSSRPPMNSQTGALSSLRAVVQVHDAEGAVVGATYWYGNEEDLASGVAVDLGCDLWVSPGSRVVAWLDDQQTICSARQALAPEYATEHPFRPFKAMKLMLRKDPTLVLAALPAEAA